MADILSKSKRSQVMAAIRSSGNRCTELKLADILLEATYSVLSRRVWAGYMSLVKDLSRETFESLLDALCRTLTNESRVGANYGMSIQFENRVRRILKKVVAPYDISIDFDPPLYVFPDIVQTNSASKIGLQPTTLAVASPTACLKAREVTTFQ